MPDKRKHRGPHPDDHRLFADAEQPALRVAVTEFAWLLTRGYAEDSALALVGNRYNLTERQRIAVRRSSCSDQSLARRWQTRRALAECLPRPLALDGYNLLITIESALSGGIILVGRDACYRDLASIHGTYRKVDETLPAVRLIADYLTRTGVKEVTWYLDRPVSNSGRLRKLMTDAFVALGLQWPIELTDNPDPILAQAASPVVTSDSWILDQCGEWINLAAEIIDARVPQSWKLDLR